MNFFVFSILLSENLILNFDIYKTSIFPSKRCSIACLGVLIVDIPCLLKLVFNKIGRLVIFLNSYIIFQKFGKIFLSTY